MVGVRCEVDDAYVFVYACAFLRGREMGGITGVNYDQTFKTDRNGEISIEGLRIGEYTVSEVNDKASAGYILPADKQAAVQTGATTIVQMHNELRDTPKTGDDFNPALCI